MAWMLNHGDGHSLFLIDEFGKGTAELDGIALLSSFINYLARKRFTAGRPRVVLTTHFLDIFRKDLIVPELVVDPSLTQNGDESSSDTARVVCTVMASTDVPKSYSATSNAVPLYELRRGISSHSNALACAAKCGIQQKLVERAQAVLDCFRCGVTASSRWQSAGPSPELHLSMLFSSIGDWQTAGDDTVSKLLAIARMGTQ
ncbi:uncharacterized protein PITG_01583 [Phytophthora infestans T30-4]|uniref:DNA mismatch repair proteins mutS family domain-containing protein n=2 Tax=Phytophthora infestans TaxID=4787 RepID=D0MTK9_PHYIT|nr:uncharacterized protein PITG_01583 [Phytophthora infestans T30-4]EEY61306.1 hypothetical protein PITG_01583 [Phytophthora infestans T30-4]|eukprot:XP_002908223.1 hypothetical protein PITG_01583 [Phytophthora infestans T30-4]